MSCIMYSQAYLWTLKTSAFGGNFVNCPTKGSTFTGNFNWITTSCNIIMHSPQGIEMCGFLVSNASPKAVIKCQSNCMNPIWETPINPTVSKYGIISWSKGITRVGMLPFSFDNSKPQWRKYHIQIVSDRTIIDIAS